MERDRGARIFLDTVFIQALLNPRDQHHARARAFAPRLRAAAEVVVTEAVLIEVGNALSAINRAGAVRFIDRCYQTRNMRVIAVDTALLGRAVRLYSARRDKGWGLTDCISFVVMQEQRIRDALTTDAHFVQAGFRALLREEP